MIKSDEQLNQAQAAVRNLQAVLAAARKVHQPGEYRAMGEPVLLELQNREQEILGYWSQTAAEATVA